MSRIAVRMSSVALMSVLVAVLTPIVFTPTGLASPRLTLYPDTAKSGDSIKAVGRGFRGRAEGILVWDDTQQILKTFSVSATGAFVITFEAPNVPPGSYQIRVHVNDSLARATLTIEGAGTPPAPTPTLPPPSPPTNTPTSIPTDTPLPAPTDTPRPSPSPTAITTTSPAITPTSIPTTSPAEPLLTATPSESGYAAAASSEIYVSPNGSDSNSGTRNAPLKTLAAALKLAQPGTAIMLREGKYTLSSTAKSVRSGSLTAPIIIRSAPGEHAILSGPSSSTTLEILHDWYVIEHLEFTGAEVLLRLNGAEHVLIANNAFHDAGGECVRIKNQSRNNTFRYNTVTNCGRTGFDLSAGRKNGEGVYVGTAPEQRSKIGGVPDASTDNVIEYNWFQTNGSEAVDLKEDAERNIVRYNVASSNRDPEGANFGARGDNNLFIGNESYGSAGAGFRTGGDTVDGRVYGKNNVFRGNNSHDNRGDGYKFMVGPQDVDCSNTGSNNGGQLYYFDNDPFPILCSGGSNPSPATPRPAGTLTSGIATPTRTPTPTGTPAPSVQPERLLPTDDAQVKATSPDTNYGSNTSYRIDAEPATLVYLKFRVDRTSGRRVVSARIRLYVTEEGKAGATLQRVPDTSWRESTISWSTRPSTGTTGYGTINSRVSSGTWIEFDVTAAITGDGVYSFVLWTPSTDGLKIVSKEAKSNQPYLVLTYG